MLGFPFYRIFNFPRNGKFFKNFPGISPENFRDPENPRNSRNSGNFRENVPGNFTELDHFDILYDFQHFRSYF